MTGNFRPLCVMLFFLLAIRKLPSDQAVLPKGFAILSSVNHPPILLGTSSFRATGWQPAAPMAAARNYLAAAVANGLIYAVGGQTVDLSAIQSSNTRRPSCYFPLSKTELEVTSPRWLSLLTTDFVMPKAKVRRRHPGRRKWPR